MNVNDIEPGNIVVFGGAGCEHVLLVVGMTPRGLRGFDLAATLWTKQEFNLTVPKWQQRAEENDSLLLQSIRESHPHLAATKGFFCNVPLLSIDLNTVRVVELWEARQLTCAA